MAEQVSLVPSVAQYELRTDLEGAEYTLKMRYADRLGVWLMDLEDENGEPIITGAWCLLNVRLLKGNTVATRPPGDLVFVSTSQDGREATFDNMGTRVELIYLTAAEVVEGYGG
jgi:hypothetical protein